MVSAISPFKLLGPQNPFPTLDTVSNNGRKVRAEKTFRSIAPNANPGGGIESQAVRIEKLIRDLNTKEAVLHLISILKNEDATFRNYAAWTLGNIGPSAKEAIPHLIIALKDEYATVRDYAVWALEKMQFLNFLML